MRFQVNKALVPMKGHYFLFNAGTGPIVPYLSVYARQLGFSSVIVGFIYTILPVFGMIAKPTFGAIADRFHCQKKFFLAAQLVTAAAFLAIFYSPKLPQDTNVTLSCNSDGITFQSNSAASKSINAHSPLWKKLESKSGFAKCELSCNISNSDRAVYCKDWNLSEYCDESNLNKILILTSVPYTNISHEFETVVFTVSNVTTEQGSISTTCSSNELKTACGLHCSDRDINTLATETDDNSLKDSEVYGMYQFWVFLILMATAWIGQAVTVSIGDAICFELLGDKHNRYGYQRMYGALGWGILSLISGVIIDLVSAGKAEDDYSVCFYMAAGFLVLDFVVSTLLKYKQTKLSSNIVVDVAQLLVNFRIIVFLLWCITVGMCTGLMWQFLLWLVEDQANAQGLDNIKTLQGIIMGVQCLGGELPFFFLSGKILKKIGHVNSMSLVLAAIGIRFILYSVIDNPWYFIPIEFSNGLTFGLFYACMASYASIVAPAGTEATMQGMVGAVFEGVGVSFGSFLAGVAWKQVKGQLTFRYFGFGTLAACGVHLVIQWCIQVKDSSPEARRKDSFQKIRLEDQRELTIEESLIPKQSNNFLNIDNP